MKNRSTIGGNGFTNLNYYQAEMLEASSVTQKQLAQYADRLGKKVAELNKIVQSMPEEMFAIVGVDLFGIGEDLNNLAGAVGLAHDSRLENKAVI